MAQAGIPTARSETFRDAAAAKDFARALGLPVVIKADGLAAGKGVAVAATWAEAEEAIDSNLRDHRFGAASASIIVEEFLHGEEASLLAITDGDCVWPLPPAEDYKRLRDGDRGPNTGGMGAFAPTPVLPEEALNDAWREVLVPAVRAMRDRGIVFRGVLYAGLMLTPQGTRVLEFNARFGDPETQVLMPLIEGDLAEAMLAAAEGRLGAFMGGRGAPGVRPDCAMTVVLAAEGYPDAPRRGDVIEGAEGLPDDTRAVLFHAGTARDAEGRIVTAGGRVLCATGVGGTLAEARRRAEGICGRVRWRGMQRRHDIGSRAQRREA
jgi:phosphoribosylamine--glycine ligase